MTLTRLDRSGFANWWWTIDRVVLVCVLSLIGIGLLLAFAASPAATGGPASEGDFRYALKQTAFAITAAMILVTASLLPLRAVKMLAAILFALALIGAAAALFTGGEIKGARRWLDFGAFKLQPTEFLKPAFVVLAAAVLTDPARTGMRGVAITALLLAPALAIMLFQPDVGQTALILAIWGALLYFAGVHALYLAGLGAGGLGISVAAYFLHPHVRERIEQFLDPRAEAYQTGLALKAFAAGGFTGVGPGAGTIKYRLPDAHSDFIFAVSGEEFGLVLCAVIVLLFGIITARLMLRAVQARERFAQLVGAGLALAIGLQAFINMSVSLSLLPAKGMTLPFVSYGGSSLFAVALTMGFALAVTRQRPRDPRREPAHSGIWGFAT